MNIHKRFIVQFFIQLVLVLILFFFVLLIVWAIIGFSLKSNEVTKDLSKADQYFFSDRITIKDGKATFADDLKKMTTSQNGVLLVLTGKGDVIGSYNTSEKVPRHLEKSEIAALILPNSPNAVKYTHWKLDKTYPQPLFLLFGKKNVPANLLNEVKSNVDWNNHQLHLSAAALRQMKEENAWAQLINSNGKVVDGFSAKEKPVHYSVQDLLSLSEDKQDSTITYFDSETEQTLIMGINDISSSLNLEENLFKSINNGILIIFVFLLLILVLGTFWYARKFGVPLLTMMKWIQNLGNGLYEQPLDLHQRSIMLNKHGKLKRKYRLYKDLIATLSQLTESLQQNETQRRKMNKIREEWISGLSHDLKTPLASISGYALMLESKNYSWTEEETRNFAGIITEKATYMKELLEDLTLTYRLSNQSLPIVKEKVDLNEFIRRTIIHFINDPANNDKELIFRPHNGTAFASIDSKWFQRIMDNLIANAIKYNPSGTTITVSISPIEQHLIIIMIEDDGIGMDNETLNKLFQRYYRGTNTSDSSNGTGLGMAITKQLVHLHGGSIQVNSTPQKGTSVRIILPV